MWSLLARFLPSFASKGILIGLPLAFAAGASVGGWGAWKLRTAWEAESLAQEMERAQRLHERSLALVKEKHAKELQIAESRIKTREVVKYVSNDPVCDVPAAAVRLLDEARGVPESATGSARAALGSPLPVGISQGAELLGHTDCGLMYQSLKAQLDALLDWHDAEGSAR